MFRPRPPHRLAAMLVATVLLTPAVSFGQGTPSRDAGATTLPPPPPSTAVDTSQGGVGGTGLGHVSKTDTMGRGDSVSGPPGQGITGTAKMPDIPP